MKRSRDSFEFIWKSCLALAVCLCSICRPCLGDPAHILSITPQPARPPGDVVIFLAEIADATAPAGLFVWESDRDGVLGVTSDLVLSRDAAGLSRGGHMVTFSVEDGAGARVLCGTAPLFVVSPRSFA